MAVPFIDIKRFEEGFLEKWLDLVKKLSSNVQFIGGEVVSELEANLQQYTQATKVVSCANGTDALQLALRAMGVGAGDRVLLPDFTFWATFEAIVNVGAKPILIDCNRQDQTIDVEKVALAIKQTSPKAVMVVHLYGWASREIKTLRLICAKLKIPLIEDSAQAFGVKVGEESIFAGAEIATTSFYPAKVLGGAGDGGAVFCRDEYLAQNVRTLSNHGRSTHYGYGAVGWNSRMDTLQAAFVGLSLQQIDKRINSRRNSAEIYRKELAGINGLQVISSPENIYENGYCNVCFVEDLEKKNLLEATLKEKQIGFGNIYPSPMSEQIGAKPYLDAISTNYLGENAAWICSHVINLPLFAYMKDEEIAEVVAVVKSVMQ